MRGGNTMDNQLPELKVNMLGKFSITYGDQPVTFKRNSATKAVKLLQILLHSSLTENQGNGGICRAQRKETSPSDHDTAGLRTGSEVAADRICAGIFLA